MNRNVSVIIPFYDYFEMVMTRLAEIYSYKSSKDIEVIVVDDGSKSSKTANLLGAAQRLYPSFRLARRKDNRGFSAAHNFGASLATGNVLCFLSSDVEVRAPFWELECWPGDIEHSIYGGRLLANSTGWNNFSLYGNEITFPYLEGWFIGCTRHNFELCGWWDEQFSPFDYEDIDLSTSAVEKGLALRVLPPEWFSHQLGGTISKKYPTERQAITERNRTAFFRKWILSGRYKELSK